MEYKFFALIIGTEILNGRREDKHFAFLRDIFKKRGLEFSGSFIIKDDPKLIENTIAFIASMKNSILFSFGGIGSTPDDYTREAAAKALQKQLIMHEEAKKIIEKKHGKNAYPHRINMALLPQGSELLPNPVNKMPGFFVEKRFFFMPGFPQMSHPMVEYILDNFFKNAGKKEYRYSFKALCSETNFIDLMKKTPTDVEISSLPQLYSDGPRTIISIASSKQELAKKEFQKYLNFMEKNKIQYSIIND